MTYIKSWLELPFTGARCRSREELSAARSRWEEGQSEKIGSHWLKENADLCRNFFLSVTYLRRPCKINPEINNEIYWKRGSGSFLLSMTSIFTFHVSVQRSFSIFCSQRPERGQIQRRVQLCGQWKADKVSRFMFKLTKNVLSFADLLLILLHLRLKIYLHNLNIFILSCSDKIGHFSFHENCVNGITKVYLKLSSYVYMSKNVSKADTSLIPFENLDKFIISLT